MAETRTEAEETPRVFENAAQEEADRDEEQREEGPRRIGPLNHVLTQVYHEGRRYVFAGHLLGKYPGKPVEAEKIYLMVRDIFKGYDETIKPIFYLVDDVYYFDPEDTRPVVAELANARQLIENLGFGEKQFHQRPDALNMLIAGYLRAKYPFVPIGIGYGVGLKAGDYVRRTVIVYFVVDRWDNLIVSCFDIDWYLSTGYYGACCWFLLAPTPAWPKYVVI